MVTNGRKMAVVIRKAERYDIKEILNLVKELAKFEKAPQEVINTEENMLKDGFSDSPLYGCYVALQNEKIIGFALYYYRYSTWKGKCLYLEDFYVKEQHRRSGIGKMLFDKIIEKAKKDNCNRINWQVLDWNINAINFYDKYNAKYDKDWWNGFIDLV